MGWRNEITVDVTECHYHRNGVSGVGFYAMRFSWMEDGIKEWAAATVSSDDFERYVSGQRHDPETRVLVFIDSRIDLSRTMRGDHFHEPLCEWLKLNHDKRIGWEKK